MVRFGWCRWLKPEGSPRTVLSLWMWKLRGFFTPWFQLPPLKKRWRRFQGTWSPHRVWFHRGSSSGRGNKCQVKLSQPLLQHCKNWHQPVLLAAGRKSRSCISWLTKQQTRECRSSSWWNLIAWLQPRQWRWDHRWRECCRRIALGLFQFWQSCGKTAAALVKFGR